MSLYKKNRASPGIVFLSYRFSQYLQTSYEILLIKLNLWYFVLSPLTISTIQTNCLASSPFNIIHWRGITNYHNKLIVIKVKLGQDYLLVKPGKGNDQFHGGFIRTSRLREYAFNKSITESHWVSITQIHYMCLCLTLQITTIVSQVRSLLFLTWM